MKAIVTVLGVIFLIAAAMYFLVPGSLPTFLPGHETGLMRIRAKHGMLSVAAWSCWASAGFLGAGDVRRPVCRESSP